MCWRMASVQPGSICLQIWITWGMTATLQTQGTLPDSAPFLWSPLSGFINSIHFLLDKAILIQQPLCVYTVQYTHRQTGPLTSTEARQFCTAGDWGKGYTTQSKYRTAVFDVTVTKQLQFPPLLLLYLQDCMQGKKAATEFLPCFFFACRTTWFCDVNEVALS